VETTIPEAALSSLERTVRRSMERGQWQTAVLTIREKAKELGVDSDELVKAVTRKALALGHVTPLRQVESLD
jgi:hypothetical protein